MYEQAFGLRSRPFISTAYTQNYFPADSIHHAMCQLRLTVERDAGPAIVTGAAGTGKSLLIAMLGDYFKRSYQVINLVCVNVMDRRDLLQCILFELGLPYRELSEGELRLSLIDFLKSQKQKRVLLLIDEAHSLSAEILDELRMVTHFSSKGQPAISLVMAGLASLEDHLIETRSESLNQRIACRCYLTNLSRQETFEYVVTQLENCGAHGESVFTSDALNVVHEMSDGCPRVINQICDYALVLAASHGQPRVSAEVVAEAWNDVQSIPTGQSQFQSENAETEDDSVVLEFGHLDNDDDTSVEFEKSYEPVNGDAEPAERRLSVVSKDSLEEAVEYRLQEEEELSSQTIELPEDLDSLMDFVQDQSAGMNPESVNNFTNPFDESFEQEETVFASFIPSVSEQNLNSLMITSEQLILLESVEARVIESSLTGQTETLEEPNTECVDSEITGHADLRMTDRSLENLANVEDDIRRLQRELMFTSEEFRSQAVHPDYEYCDQPIEELFQEHTVVQESEPGDLSASVVEDIVDEVQDSDDDRDIMIISRPEKFLDQSSGELDLDLELNAPISTGTATRMNYHDLFKQLRSAT